MGVAMFLTLFVLLCLGVPIAVCIGFASIAGMLVTSLPTNPIVIGQRMFTAVDSFPFMAIPFFMLAGGVMEHGGISRRLVRLASTLVGSLRGGLGLITVVASAFFGAISGSNPATVAAIGGIMAPSMIKKKYPPDFAAAVCAASGTLGVIIPPSIPMITYGVVAGVSIGDLFLAGIIPGLFLALVLCACVWGMAARLNIPMESAVSGREVLAAFGDASLALIMPAIILGGIYGGVFTPTEAGAVATAYSLLVSFLVYREMDLATLRTVIIKAGISSAMVFFVIATSQSFSWLINVGRISQLIATTMLGLTSNPFLILTMINILLLFLGVFLETQAIILLMAPILLPIAQSIGLDPLLLGIIIVVNTSIGMITPPMAVNLFVAQGIVREYGTTLERISRRIIPFFLAELIALLLISNVPSISLGLLQLIR